MHGGAAVAQDSYRSEVVFVSLRVAGLAKEKLSLLYFLVLCLVPREAAFIILRLARASALSLAFKGTTSPCAPLSFIPLL
jgi:hypothetical protein